MKTYLALFGTSGLVTAVLVGYAVFAHGKQMLGLDMYPDDERPVAAQIITDSCVRRAAGADRYTPESFTQFCGCYANELLNIASVSDFKSIENGVTYKFQIKADRATALCRAKVSLAHR